MTDHSRIIRSIVLICVLALSHVAGADVLRIFPERIDIHPLTASQRVVVTLTDARGVTSDVTSEANVTLENTALVRWQSGTLAPLSSGSTRLVVDHAGLSATADVKIARGAETAAPSFQNEVVPVLMRYGCSAGGCHGATRGKDGFRLSLFGYDPDADHFRLTREFVNRRVNVALPEDSLLLKKSAGTVPHGGGKKLTPSDPNFDLLRDWIAAGAPKSPADEAHMSSVSVYPSDLTLDAAGQSHRLVVMGAFTDDSQRDVTHLSILESSDDSIASVTREGVVTSHRRGEVFISVRLPAFISGVRVDVVPGQQPPASLQWDSNLAHSSATSCSLALTSIRRWKTKTIAPTPATSPIRIHAASSPRFSGTASRRPPVTTTTASISSAPAPAPYKSAMAASPPPFSQPLAARNAKRPAPVRSNHNRPFRKRSTSSTAAASPTASSEAKTFQLGPRSKKTRSKSSATFT